MKQLSNRRFISFVWVLACLVFVACRDEKQDGNKKDSLQQKALLMTEEIQVPQQQIALLSETRAQVGTWLAYITAQSEMNNLEGLTLGEVVLRSEKLAQIMKTLDETVPKIFQTKPILSRIQVLVTLTSVLKQKASHPAVTAKELRHTVEKLPVAFKNLKIQLNEVYQKDLEDFKLLLNQDQPETISDNVYNENDSLENFKKQ